MGCGRLDGFVGCGDTASHGRFQNVRNNEIVLLLTTMIETAGLIRIGQSKAWVLPGAVGIRPSEQGSGASTGGGYER